MEVMCKGYIPCFNSFKRSIDKFVEDKTINGYFKHLKDFLPCLPPNSVRQITAKPLIINHKHAGY